MKRPSYPDLTTAVVALDVDLERITQSLRAIDESPEYYTDPDRSRAGLRERAEQLGRVRAWLEHLRTQPRPVSCTAGRNHRVREAYDQGDGITVERCRCGAERVRDVRAVGDEVTDWRRPQ